MLIGLLVWILVYCGWLLASGLVHQYSSSVVLDVMGVGGLGGN